MKNLKFSAIFCAIILSGCSSKNTVEDVDAGVKFLNNEPLPTLTQEISGRIKMIYPMSGDNSICGIKVKTRDGEGNIFLKDSDCKLYKNGDKVLVITEKPLSVKILNIKKNKLP